MTRTAKDIYQSYLDAFGPRFVDGDVAAILPHVHLPYRQRIDGAVRVCLSTTETEQFFLELHHQFQKLGATHFHRICEDARFLGTDLIEGFHVNRVECDGVLLMPEFASGLLLRLRGDVWKCSEATCGARCANLTMPVPKGHNDAFASKPTARFEHEKGSNL